MECPVPSESNSNDWILVKPKSKHSLRCIHSVIPSSSSVIAKGDSAASNHYCALVMPPFLTLFTLNHLERLSFCQINPL